VSIFLPLPIVLFGLWALFVGIKEKISKTLLTIIVVSIILIIYLASRFLYYMFEAFEGMNIGF